MASYTRRHTQHKQAGHVAICQHTPAVDRSVERTATLSVARASLVAQTGLTSWSTMRFVAPSPCVILPLELRGMFCESPARQGRIFSFDKQTRRLISWRNIILANQANTLSRCYNYATTVPKHQLGVRRHQTSCSPSESSSSTIRCGVVIKTDGGSTGATHSAPFARE